jgi:hypothetical protein
MHWDIHGVVGLAPGEKKTFLISLDNIFAQKFGEKWRFLAQSTVASFCKN